MPTIDTLQEFLLKARRRLSDENPDYSDQDESNPDSDRDYDDSGDDDTEGDAADQWLKTHAQRGDETKEVDPHEDAPEEKQAEGEIAPLDEAPAEAEEEVPPPSPVKQFKPNTPAPGYNEYGAEDDEDSHQAEAVAAPAARPRMIGQQGKNDPDQPSREELQDMRVLTRPWEARLRQKAQLEAEPTKNPHDHREGRLLEAHKTAHADKNSAMTEMKASDEYKKASVGRKMLMERKFHNDWRQQNPEHATKAMSAFDEAHKKGEEGRAAFARAKDEKIRHIGGGGNQPGAMSLEEGMQHAGGSREDEDSAPSGIQQDPGASFAAGNQEFMRQYMDDYNKRSKKFSAGAPEDEYAQENRPDPESVLGEHASQDPGRKARFNQFFNKYYGLIQDTGKRVINKLGLQDKGMDEGLLNYAGMHALYQAVNDYDHDHPSKASFKTHLTRKMTGLMQTALKSMDEIPPELRSGAKKFDQVKRTANASPIKQTNAQGVTTTINAPAPAAPAQPAAPQKSAAEIASAHHPDIQDRLKRVAAARGPIVRKQGALQPKPVAAPKPKWNVNNVSGDEGGEE